MSAVMTDTHRDDAWEFDPELPVFVVEVEGKVLFRTQTPGRAYNALTALKHGRKQARLVVLNDRRKEDR